MTGLQLGWSILFVAAVFLFLAVELLVIIGGAGDIAAMMKALRQDREEEGETG